MSWISGLTAANRKTEAAGRETGIKGWSMMKKINQLRSSMAVNTIGAIVFLLILLGIIAIAFGFMSFTNTFTEEYSTSTFHMADTATTLVNGDHLDSYLKGENREEYLRSKKYLDQYCKKISVSLIYVIQVDRSDYGRFVSIFNPVDNSVDHTNYTEWELGHKRDTTNDEYRQKYQALYEKKAPYESVIRSRPTDGQHPHITTMVPVKNSSGDVTAILCMQRPIRELHEARHSYVVDVAVSTILFAVIASVFAVIYLRKQIINPIKKVSEEATRFAKENTLGEPLGEIGRFEEISKLAASIDTMEVEMVDYTENLTKITAERERIITELSLASTIQDSSVPHIFPAFPDRSEFDIFASMTPAKQVGGDFYNFLLVDDDHLAMMIGDVSDKGIPAALFMMVSNIMVYSRTNMGGTPAEILNYVNEHICLNNETDMFVTLWLGILEISTGRLIAANAGHENPAVYRKNGSFELSKTKHGLVIGAMQGIQYRDYEIQLEKGDKLFLYTDGVPEATDKDNRMFTTERMLHVLNRNKDRSPQEILSGIAESIAAFVGDAPQFDDLTMLCVELK